MTKYKIEECGLTFKVLPILITIRLYEDRRSYYLFIGHVSSVNYKYLS